MPAERLVHPERVFLSLDEFYDDDERRKPSGEVDYGVMWGPKWPYYRVSWIKATGDLYAFEQGPSRHVVLLGRLPTRSHVEAALDGWGEHCREGVAWVEYALRRYAELFFAQISDDDALTAVPRD